MKLKVCGMKYADNIREAAKLGPDFMGFIFYPASKRYVGEDFQIPEMPADIKKVGVFVNDTAESILGKSRIHRLDFVQLHGDESASFCRELKGQVGVIKAFGIDEKFDFSVLNDYEASCDYFLFDTKTKDYGGSGKGFDKDILSNYTLPVPYFLSGGIGPEALKGGHPQMERSFALDVNSKFETEPGVKDIHKLKLFKNELSSR